MVSIIFGEPVLSAAVGAALPVVGWSTVRILSEDQFRAAGAATGEAKMVLIADARGRLPDVRQPPLARNRVAVVAIATRAGFAWLARALESGSALAAIDAEQPLPNLIAALDEFLLAKHGHRDPLRSATRLRAREQEAHRFSELTRREQHVLGSIMGGQAVSEIAAAEHVSVTTVRGHIRGILTKLGVTSQLAAIAMAHRSCRESAVQERMREINQF